MAKSQITSISEKPCVTVAESTLNTLDFISLLAVTYLEYLLGAGISEPRQVFVLSKPLA
jgi:hypothetical protein